MWDQIWITVQQEFSDLGSLSDLVRIFIRLLTAAALGAVLGYERESSGATAGFRTYMLVSLGSALFVLAPLQAGMKIEDLSRVLQGLAAGIGFLGAGAIIKFRNEEQIKGLTTAAGIWLTCAVGMACGMGLETIAIISTILGFFIFSLLRITKHSKNSSED